MENEMVASSSAICSAAAMRENPCDGTGFQGSGGI
jgi:hypothetical protein